MAHDKLIYNHLGDFGVRADVKAVREATVSSIMMEERIGRLTQRQKDCLQLVAQGYTSKQIGRKLGISYSTVDNHIQAAIQMLEVDGRAEAGRLCAGLVEDGHRQRLPSQSPGLAKLYSVSDDAGILQHRGWRQFWVLVAPPIGGKENDLSPSQSILAIARIAFVAVLIFIACIIIVKVGFKILI